MKILVLGASGMLGHTVFGFLKRKGHDVYGTARYVESIEYSANILNFDVIKDKIEKLKIKENQYDFVINCIGVIRHQLNNSLDSLESVIKVNSLFPINLHNEISESETKVIQIGTDCVYSGESGNYNENSKLDPNDRYGFSKALGEFSSANQMLVRCSIIGRETKTLSSLLEWVLQHPNNSRINGYLNHRWNGVTTYAFARVITGIMENDLFTGSTVHLVPSGEISKHDLVALIAETFGRDDLKIDAFKSDIEVNRTISTLYPDANAKYWGSSGYKAIPNHHELLLEYARYLEMIRKEATH